MDIKITIPTLYKDRIITGVSSRYGYQETIEQLDEHAVLQLVPNPETREKFVVRTLKRLIKEAVVAWEASQVYQASQQSIASELSELDS